MIRFVRLAAVAALVGAACMTLPNTPARAADGAVLTAGFQYAPPTITITQGDGLNHTNADIAPHDVVEGLPSDNDTPLFSSAQAGIGETETVNGVESLDAGEYKFFCSLHPNMRGSLVVQAESPLPDLPATPELPDAETVQSLAVGGVVPTPTSLTIHGSNMYVASYGTGSVYELPILAGGLLGNGRVYASGFTSPLGVEFDGDGTLFVSDSHPSARADRGTAGRVWAIPPGGGDAAAVGSVVVDELPNGRHNTNGLAVHEGRLYITNGNSTDDGVSGGDPEEPLSGTLISVALNARGIVVPAPPAPTPAAITVEAIGMRNDYDVAFRPGTDEAWITVNGPDAFDPYGEDTLVAGPVGDGTVEDYGFPACLYTADPTLPRVKQNPEVVGTHTCGDHVAPKALVGLHVSADGLAFGPDDDYWGGDIFIAEFGNFFGDKIVGHKILRVPVDENGNTGTPRDFFVGAAPLDLTFGPDGLYVADFATGQITLLRGPAA